MGGTHLGGSTFTGTPAFHSETTDCAHYFNFFISSYLFLIYFVLKNCKFWMHLQKGSPHCGINSPAWDEFHSSRDVVFVCRFKFHSLFWAKFQASSKVPWPNKIQQQLSRNPGFGRVLLGAFLLRNWTYRERSESTGKTKLAGSWARDKNSRLR